MLRRQADRIWNRLKARFDWEVVRRVKELIHDEASLGARYWPYEPGRSSWVISNENESVERAADELPVPPPRLWAGYCNDPVSYVRSGREHYDAMMASLSATGFQPAPDLRILDFGCAAGRMLRNFRDQAATGEVWGTDISAPHIVWCRQHLSPPFQFVTSTTFPNLPFEDNYFDLIYAASVFTHIGDLEDAWLMELRRIAKPGGRLYLTIHDDATSRLLLSSAPGDWLYDSKLRRDLVEFDAKTHVLDSPYGMFITSRDPGNTQVFHHSDYIRKHWARMFKLRSMTPEGSGYQTAVVLEKT